MLRQTTSLAALSLAFAPDGGLLASTSKGLVRLAADGKKVLATRKGAYPAFAVSPAGVVFVAEKNKVVACEPLKLTAKPVKLPAPRGALGIWRELAVSPSGSFLAAATRAGDAFVLELKSGKVSSCPAYGAPRTGLFFSSETELCAVREGIVDGLTFSTGRNRQLGNATFGVGDSSFFAGWDHTSTLTIIDAHQKAKTLKLRHDGMGTQVALVPGASTAVASSGGELCLFDLKKAKIVARTRFARANAIAATTDQLALSTDDGIFLGALADAFA